MGKNAQPLAEREQIDSLCGDIDAIVGIGKQELRKIGNKIKWLVGEAIVASPLYRRYSRGQGDLMKTLAAQLGYGEKNMYDWVRFYEKFPKGEYDLDAPWGKIRAALPAPKNNDAPLVEACRHCAVHNCPKP